MWNKSINFEVIVICFLSLIPWPGPSVFKISCSRESTRVVRKIVQSKWLPILEKYQVKLPMECPFHPLRDIFGPQQAAKKQNRPSQFECGFCGKSFFEEKFLDLHFETRHKNNINMAEDAVCLADYCDIMRCEVLISHDSTLSFGDSIMMTTDIEIWSESTAYRTALMATGPRELAKLPTSFRGIFMPPLPNTKMNIEKTMEVPFIQPSEHKHCEKNEHGSGEAIESSSEEKSENDEKDESEETDSNTTTCDKDLVDSALPPVDKKQQRLSELQKLKANCKTEDLEKIKIKCEILVRDCIAGLLVQLSQQDFKEMEEELNRAVCWYLTCDRYWEDGPPEPRAFPWGLVFILVMVLSLGVCFCYYIIWVLFDTDDLSGSSEVTAHSSPTNLRHHHSVGNFHQNLHYHPSGSQNQPVSSIQHQNILNQQHAASGSSGIYSDDYAAAAAAANNMGAEYGDLGQSEHYIYVTYPPELKRRLLESCYNRTTRL